MTDPTTTPFPGPCAAVRSKDPPCTAPALPRSPPRPNASTTPSPHAWAEAIATVDMHVLDHLVVGDGETVSFAERGWL